VIGLDTNVLARYYIQDESDAEAKTQHEAAKSLLESGQPLMVCKTVILEFEWVMRGYDQFSASEIGKVFQHLLSQKHITLEDEASIRQAFSSSVEAGLDFADALHHASYKHCAEIASFDNKKFIRRAKRAGLMPPVRLQ
jgi:predicted nucleic-acid-binding protein